MAPMESPGRLLAIDLGAKRVGVAVSDELRITIKPLAAIERRSAQDVRSVASKFQRSLDIPVYLQDERLTSFDAAANLRTSMSDLEIDAAIDSEAAALILRDFIVSNDRPDASGLEPGSY